jgi:hypothetical protein
MRYLRPLEVLITPRQRQRVTKFCAPVADIIRQYHRAHRPDFLRQIKDGGVEGVWAKKVVTARSSHRLLVEIQKVESLLSNIELERQRRRGSSWTGS